MNYLRVIKQYSGCWELKIPRKRDGITHVKIEGEKLYRASRVSAALYLGMELNDPYTAVSFKCKNRACWNPEHLILEKL